MAMRSVSVRTLTPTVFADTIAMTTLEYLAHIQGSTALQRVHIHEVYMGGQAGASAPSIMVGGMNSTAVGTPVLGTVAEDAPLDGATAALASPVDAGTGNTIGGQRSATLGHQLNLSFNAFGGIVRWLAAPGGEIGLTGVIADTGSWSLSAFTGGTIGLMGSHVHYESL